ncbi:unnamed protein product [Cladocopium goreaui]|uniref:USP domain-containing protein n=1 Tax=Cladocopium goreaui TaxID=2562237 RepID=A0A9P1GGV0_9DINO|nr:unnamed protein product [Cladocopium goreaui]
MVSKAPWDDFCDEIEGEHQGEACSLEAIVHAAMTAADIEEKLQPALDACRREPDTTILCFLDEVNTASCLGFVKAMLCDDLFGQHNANLFVVAAANPYREEEKAEDHVLRGSATVMRDFFQVHLELEVAKHSRRRALCIAVACQKDEPTDFPCFARSIADAQQFMRRELKSASAVSQRDIIRVVSLLDFFWRRSYSAVEASERCRLARALLLALGVAYYLGLNREQRDRFVKEVTEKHYTGIQGEETQHSLDLTQVLMQEMDQYIKPIKDDEELADGIALTRALKENIFAVIVGIECNIPVMIVGMPGTGKTLAVNKATSVLRGTNSVHFFRRFSDVANSVFRYQCSKDSTSRQIHEVFESALRAKQRYDAEDAGRRPVVFLDEAGLPKEKVESLKAIHYWIDDGRIFCCLLANKPLDAAKRNRCLQVFRDKADEEDLELLASVCLGVNLEDPTSKSMVKGFCGAFQEISEQSWKDQDNAFSMFHLRDFHHCLRYLRRHGHVQSGSASSLSVLRALERNFGGLKKEDFQRLIDIFFRHLERETGGLLTLPERSQLRGTLDVLREALDDLPPEDLQDARYEPCRYKLIIDETEDGGAVRILQAAGLLPMPWEVLEVSDLPGDRSDLHRSQTVSNLRRAAEQAGTCVMIAYDEILDGFYDLLNLRFQRLPGSGRVRFAATVAAGSYSVLAPVDPRFMLVVCIKASELPSTPLPFLNRFEKFYVGPAEWALHQAHELCLGNINHQLLDEYLLEPARGRLEALVQLIGDASLIGYSGVATLDSSLCDALREASLRAALEALSAAWREERVAAVQAVHDRGPCTAPRWPEDVDGRMQTLGGETIAGDLMTCYGHENAGNTCFLQACLTLLAVNERFLLPPQRANEMGILSDLRHILKKSRQEVVGQVDMRCLTQKLEQAQIVERAHQMDDAAIVFEGLLDCCQSPKLPLHTFTCASPEDCRTFGYPSGTVARVQEQNDYVIRTTPRARANLQTLLQERMLAPVADCKTETEAGEEHLLRSAIRAKQRPLNSCPPMALPICVERWHAGTMEKNNDHLSVPLEGLRLPLLPPTHRTLQISELEFWRYNLCSFVLHVGQELHSGHYIAYWKSSRGWHEVLQLHVNDDRCSDISEQEAQRRAGSAYFLIYQLAGYQGMFSWESLNEQAVGRQLLDQRLKDVIARLSEAAAQRLLRLAPSEVLLSRQAALPQSLLQGYAERPHTGLGSVLAALRRDPSTRLLVLTRDVMLASGLCPSEHLKRRDVEIQPMPRTREECVALLQGRKNKEPLMIVCRLAHGQCSDTSCTSQAIHQLRRLADENDVHNLVVTILLPPWRFHDSLEDAEAPSLVSSILMNTKPSTEPLGCQEEVYKHLWAAVARLPSSEAMQVYAEGWEEVEQCMAHAVSFYTQPALQTRVDALWKLLTSHKLSLLLDGLQRLPAAVLQDVSLQREAVAAAKEMMGMDRGQRRPMFCLQTTVGNKCAERVVSALAAALHLICDQGGVQVLLHLGDEATLAVATYLRLRVSPAGWAKTNYDSIWTLSQDAMILPCYPPLFQALQECLLDSRADDTEEDYLVAACTSAWHKHAFFELSHCVVKSGLMGSYCKYLAQRFGFPSVAAELLEVSEQIQY